MIVPLLGLLIGFSPQSSPVAATVYVVSIVDERAGDDVFVRFVLSGPPSSYSATTEGNEIVVRIAAEAIPGLALPTSRDPIRSLTLGPAPGFSLRVALGEGRTHEILRDLSSLRLVIRRPAPKAAPAPTPEATAGANATNPEPKASPSPGATRSNEPAVADTADLYRRLFPGSNETVAASPGRTEIGAHENWYSNFTWLGLQVRPWVSVSFVDGKTTQVQSKLVTADSYWVVQPNLGFGFSPHFGGTREGQWKINYTPRFRRLVDLNLPRLTSHFFDAGIDQPVASFGSIYGTYHFSKGVLETDEIDPGREYGIGLNRVIDTSLERFRRNSIGFGVRVNVVAETVMDINVNKTAVRYGHVPEDEPFRFGERAFFDYDTRTFNASLRRGVGESRFLSLLFGIHDTPTQKEREQVEGRGYSYGAALEGDIAALTTGRLMFGYRSQKNPHAGPGGQDYKDVTYAAQLVRQISEDTSLGFGADRNLYLSAYEDNGFYIADSLRGDLSTRLPLALFLRGNLGLQTNSYKTSPQVNDGASGPVLRKDSIRSWSLGVARNFTSWAYLRLDYTSERRNSNLDRFDIKTRAVTFQLGLGFFGTPSSPVQAAW